MLFRSEGDNSEHNCRHNRQGGQREQRAYCNVTGDGALTLMLTGYAEKHGIADTGDLESPIL